MDTKPGSGIQVIARAAAILREVSASAQALSLGQLAASTGLPRSTVQRIVDALESEHLVQAGAQGVRPGWGLRRFGEMAGPGVARYLRPPLFKLFESTGHTVDLSTLAGPEVLFMDRFLAAGHGSIAPVAGALRPAYTMASGKALLSMLGNDEVKALYGQGALRRLTAKTASTVDALIDQLDLIRAGGFAYDREEHALGGCGIGLPVSSSTGQQLSISVVLLADQWEGQQANIEKALRQCAADCKKVLAQLPQ